MSTFAHYHPRNIDIDLANPIARDLYDEIASLRGHIPPPPAPPVFTCLGNHQPMYVYRNSRGRYFLRHYPNGAADCGGHELTTMTDEHRRQADYTRRAAENHGLDAALEFPTGNGTRLDVAISGGQFNSGFEIQRSGLTRARAKSRAKKSFDAGWPTAWVTDQEDDPDWADHVPTARLTVRERWSVSLPPPNTARVIISDFSRERDKAAESGWRYVRQPKAVLLDELAYLMPSGEIIPVAVGKRGLVSLAFSTARDVIDSCTYPGASTWNPSDATPSRQEAAQAISRECLHDATPPATITCSVCNLPISSAFGITAHYDCMDSR